MSILFFLCFVIYDPKIYFNPACSLGFLGETFLQRGLASSYKCLFFGLLFATFKYIYFSLSLDFFYKVLLLGFCLLLVLSLSLLSAFTAGLLFFSYFMMLLLSREEKFLDLLFLLYGFSPCF